MKLIKLVMCIITLTMYAQREPWTWHYHKSLPNNIRQNELVYSKMNVPAFTQLLFSWNAFRPDSGHYSFYVQVRNAHEKRWGPWHKMIDWGAHVQRSYESKSDGTCRYLYVRLETESGHKADAFRIKLVADNTSLNTVKGFSVNTSDFSKFCSENCAYSSLKSVVVDAVPKKSQLILPHAQKRMMCSPTSCSMLLEFLTKKEINPLHFAQSSFDYGLKAYGSWQFNTAHAFELAGGNMRFYTGRLHSFLDLHHKLSGGIPVVVSVRGAIVGAPKSYKNGHLLLVVGYDAKSNRVICHDPAAADNQQTYKKYPIQSFVRAWERSRRLSYIAAPKLA